MAYDPVGHILNVVAGLCFLAHRHVCTCQRLCPLTPGPVRGLESGRLWRQWSGTHHGSRFPPRGRIARSATRSQVSAFLRPQTSDEAETWGPTHGSLARRHASQLHTQLAHIPRACKGKGDIGA